jgi:RNA polymerase sigma-70 factor, ECF subfamily
MDEDMEIVQRFKAGDTGAFSILMGKYKKPILNLIYRFTGNADEAEDLAQEVFLRAYRGLSSFKAEAKFFTWLYRIAVNLSIRARQRKSKFKFQSLDQKTEDGCTEINLALSETSGADREILKEELCKRVRQAISELPEDQRVAVVLHRYQDLQYDEIAEIMKITVAAVKSRLHRARIVLREKLGPYVEET